MTSRGGLARGVFSVATYEKRFQGMAKLERDGNRRRLCGRSPAAGVKLHVDHVIPWSADPGLPDQLALHTHRPRSAAIRAARGISPSSDATRPAVHISYRH